MWKKRGDNMKILILSRDDDKKFIKWAETDNLKGLWKLANYFASSSYCKDFIIYWDFENGTDQPRAMSFPLYCEREGIILRWDKDETGKLIKRG